MSEDLQDLKYVNRDGDSMRGPLALSGDSILDAHATSKRFVETLLANLRSRSLLRDGSQAMTGPLTLSGPPTSALHASSRDYVNNVVAGAVAPLATVVYVDAQDVIERAYADALNAAMTIYVDAQDVIDRAYADGLDAAMTIYVDAADALMLRIDGSIPMTGLLTLSGDPLLAMEAATKQYVDAIPVGPSTYDAVVAAAGGDYTSVVAACAGEGVGARIYIKTGTYNEVADVDMKDGQQLIGENPDDTIIDFGAGAFKIVLVGGAANLVVENLTVQNGIANYTIELGGDNCRVDNCRLIGSAAAFDGLYMGGNESVTSRTRFTGYSRLNFSGARIEDYGVVYGCTFETSSFGLSLQDYCLAYGNVFETIADTQINFNGFSSSAVCNMLTGGGGSQIRIANSYISIVGNFITGTGGIYWQNAQDLGTITGNTFSTSQIDCDKNGSEEWTVSGNTFQGGGGLNTDGQRWSITGNIFQGVANILLDTNSLECVVTGNSMWGIAAAAKITDNGNINMSYANHGVSRGDDKLFSRMKNTSGGALVAGDVVVQKAVAAGDEFTTTVNQGDDMVLGMLEAGIANDAYGPVQTEGKTVKLKVNGVAAIVIGDLIGTHTVAGIARQAAAGDMAFAIALEVYAGADSNGVIDALLIKPRKV